MIVKALLAVCMIVLPALAVIGMAYLLVKKHLINEAARRKHELEKAAGDKLLPSRIQAYERLVLYLERISPNNLVMRTHKPGMSAKLMHAELLKAIRHEFEHNLAQQIYVSIKAWEMTKTAKEETIKIINIAATKVDKTGDAYQLSRAIFELEAQLDSSATQPAIDFIKIEVTKNFY